jgi:hypothetical protein
MVAGYQLIPSDSLSVVQPLLSLDVPNIRVLISLSFLFLFAFTMFTNIVSGMECRVPQGSLWLQLRSVDLLQGKLSENAFSLTNYHEAAQNVIEYVCTSSSDIFMYTYQ